MKYLKFKSISLLVIMSILIACGGTDEIAEKMDEAKEVVQEKMTSDDPSEETKDIPNLTGELSVEVTVEVAPLTLSILEGKAQFNMRDGQGWIDAVDAQPIEQGWGVKTLAVSTAILNFEDGSMVLLEPTTEVEISLYQLINGGVSEGGERHVNVKIVNGGVSFDVVPAESPPNTWAFLTPDGAVTIQGTGGSLSRRVGMAESMSSCGSDLSSTMCVHPAATIDTKLELIEGTATMMRMKSEPSLYNEDGSIQEDFEVDKELQAMVVKPGVAFQSAEEKPISAEMIEADPLLAADVGYIVSLAGADVVDEEVLEVASEVALESDETTKDLAILQVAALAGPEGVEAISEAGNIDAALEITNNRFEEESVLDPDMLLPVPIDEVLEASEELQSGAELKAVDENAAELIAEAAEFQKLYDSGEISADELLEIQTELVDTVGDFEGATVVENTAGIDEITGKKIGFDGAVNSFKEKFLPPMPEPLFDENGNQIGVKQPDQVIFDPNGNPIGKKMGDMVATDVEGNQIEGKVPDVFYLGDKGGEDKLVATTFFNAFAPKAPVAGTAGASAGLSPIPLSTFDPDGNLVPTIIEYDLFGNPKGSIPLDPAIMKTPNGLPPAPPMIPALDYNSDGTLAEVLEMPFLSVDNITGEFTEFMIPSPIVFGPDGDPVGMAAGTTIGIGSDGFSGMKPGEIIGKDFFVEQSSAMLERAEAGIAAGPAIDFASGILGDDSAPIDLFDAIAFVEGSRFKAQVAQVAQVDQVDQVLLLQVLVVFLTL